MTTVINLNTDSTHNKWTIDIDSERVERMTVLCVSATLANRKISQADVVFGSAQAEKVYQQDSAAVSAGW